MPVIPVFRKLSQEGHEFRSRLGYIIRACFFFKKKTKYFNNFSHKRLFSQKSEIHYLQEKNKQITVKACHLVFRILSKVAPIFSKLACFLY